MRLKNILLLSITLMPNNLILCTERYNQYIPEEDRKWPELKSNIKKIIYKKEENYILTQIDNVNNLKEINNFIEYINIKLKKKRTNFLENCLRRARLRERILITQDRSNI